MSEQQGDPDSPGRDWVKMQGIYGEERQVPAQAPHRRRSRLGLALMVALAVVAVATVAVALAKALAA